EGPRPYLGAIFPDAVIIAGDRARADIGARADAGIADIAEVVHLGPRRDVGILDLAEIADLRLVPHHRARTKARKWPDRGARPENCAFEMAEGVDDGAIP